MKIIFVGLSNKKDMEPFDEKTNSGKIIHTIISKIEDECYKMNLVSYAPVDKNNKLRYPTSKEINQEMPYFIKKVKKINPDIIIAFGITVGRELKKIKQFENKLIIEKHPSYIYVYKRKELDAYIDNIVLQINHFKEKYHVTEKEQLLANEASLTSSLLGNGLST